MLTNDERTQIEEFVKLLNNSPWNVDNKIDVYKVTEIAIIEGVDVVLDRYREEDLQKEQEYIDAQS